MGKVKKYFHNLSFRTSFILYIVIFAVIALALILSTIALCQIATDNIYEAYPYAYYLLTPKAEGLELSGDVGFLFNNEMPFSEDDNVKIAILNIITLLCIPIYSVFCLIAATMLFYRNKMSKPLAVLREAHQRISNNDLDFTAHYSSKDEMGELVESFEKMRVVLLANNRRMWRQMEQRKQLNAAFAHDLRTPLTVLKGYSEILQNDSANSGIKDTAEAMKRHIGRLERYADSMSKLQKLEDISPNYSNTNLTDFLKSAAQLAEIICEDAGKRLSFNKSVKTTVMMLDKDIIFQVMENLVSNAVRYAKSEVTINIAEENNTITLTVQDNGDGFSSESFKRATEPYYSGDTDRSNHFGLGLYVCKILCEHHGGGIQIENTDNGAKVTTTFMG